MRGQNSASAKGVDTSADALLKSRLPEVVTVYAPIDPVGLLRSIRPAWVAIDLGDSGHLAWLDPLLTYCSQTSTPTVGWGCNPLSENLSVASTHARVVVWPFRTLTSRAKVAQSTDSIASHFEPAVRQVEPLVLSGDGPDTLSSLLERGCRRLASIRATASESLLADTLALHWQLIRSIENMPVPTDLYEVESEKTWGLRSIGRLASSAEKFREAVKSVYPRAVKPLAEVGAALAAASDWVRANDPPIWTALCNLCLETLPTGCARLVVFPSYTRKRLFQLGLLARHNISDDDLRELRILTTSFRELRARAVSPLDVGVTDSLAAIPLVIGLPSWRASHTMDCLLEYDRVQFLLLAHQVSGLGRRLHEWSQWLAPDVAGWAEVIGTLIGRRPPVAQYLSKASLILDSPKELEVETLKRRASERLEKLVALNDPAEEASALFEPPPDDDGDRDLLSERGEAADPGGEPSGEVWCDAAVFLEFEHRWTGLFAEDDMVNVVATARSGLHTEERYVRSVRVGDRVMLIHGSRRQSLYDLIVERVHRHPAIELHLALLRRWQDDLKDALRRWEPRTLDDLLHELIKRGSRLTSSGTLYHWLRGWTLCPQDSADILRTAEALNMPFLQKNHRAVARAASRVRGLHISLSLRLGRWLTDQPQSTPHGTGDDVIDEELGLTFNDFRSSIVVVTVVKVTARTGPILRSSLGRVTQEA